MSSQRRPHYFPADSPVGIGRRGQNGRASARSSLGNTSAYDRFDEVTWLVDLSSRIGSALQSPARGLRDSAGPSDPAVSTPRSRVRLPRPSQEFRELRDSLNNGRNETDAYIAYADDIDQGEQSLYPEAPTTPASEWIKHAQDDFDRRRAELRESRRHLEPPEDVQDPVDPAVERSLLAARSLQELMQSGGMEAEGEDEPPHFAELLENAEAFPAATEAGPSSLFEAHRTSQGALDIESVLKHRAQLAMQEASQQQLQSSHDRPSMLDIAASSSQKPPVIEMISADPEKRSSSPLSSVDDDEPDESNAHLADQIAFVDGQFRIVPASTQSSQTSPHRPNATLNAFPGDTDEGEEEDDDDVEEYEDHDEEEEGDDDDEMSDDEVAEESEDADELFGGQTRDLLTEGPVGDEEEPIVLSDSDEDQLTEDGKSQLDEDDDELHGDLHEGSPTPSEQEDSTAEDNAAQDTAAEDSVQSENLSNAEAMHQLIQIALSQDTRGPGDVSAEDQAQALTDFVDNIQAQEDAMPEDEVEGDDFDEDLRWSTGFGETSSAPFQSLPLIELGPAPSGFVSASQVYAAQDLAAHSSMYSPEPSASHTDSLAPFDPIDPELFETGSHTYPDNTGAEVDMVTTPPDLASLDQTARTARSVSIPDEKPPMRHMPSDSLAPGFNIVILKSDHTRRLPQRTNSGRNSPSEGASAEPSRPVSASNASDDMAGPSKHQDLECIEPTSPVPETLHKLPEVLEDPLKLAVLREETQHTAASSVSAAGSDRPENTQFGSTPLVEAPQLDGFTAHGPSESKRVKSEETGLPQAVAGREELPHAESGSHEALHGADSQDPHLQLEDTLEEQHSPRSEVAVQQKAPHRDASAEANLSPRIGQATLFDSAPQGEDAWTEAELHGKLTTEGTVAEGAPLHYEAETSQHSPRDSHAPQTEDSHVQVLQQAEIHPLVAMHHEELFQGDTTSQHIASEMPQEETSSLPHEMDTPYSQSGMPHQLSRGNSPQIEEGHKQELGQLETAPQEMSFVHYEIDRVLEPTVVQTTGEDDGIHASMHDTVDPGANQNGDERERDSIPLSAEQTENKIEMERNASDDAFDVERYIEVVELVQEDIEENLDRLASELIPSVEEYQSGTETELLASFVEDNDSSSDFNFEIVEAVSGNDEVLQDTKQVAIEFDATLDEGEVLPVEDDSVHQNAELMAEKEPLARDDPAAVYEEEDVPSPGAEEMRVEQDSYDVDYAVIDRSIMSPEAQSTPAEEEHANDLDERRTASAADDGSRTAEGEGEPRLVHEAEVEDSPVSQTSEPVDGLEANPDVKHTASADRSVDEDHDRSSSQDHPEDEVVEQEASDVQGSGEGSVHLDEEVDEVSEDIVHVRTRSQDKIRGSSVAKQSASEHGDASQFRVESENSARALSAEDENKSAPPALQNEVVSLPASQDGENADELHHQSSSAIGLDTAEPEKTRTEAEPETPPPDEGPRTDELPEKAALHNEIHADAAEVDKAKKSDGTADVSEPPRQEDAAKALVPPSPASSDRRSLSNFTPTANRLGHRHFHGARRNLFSQLTEAVSGVATTIAHPLRALQPLLPIGEGTESTATHEETPPEKDQEQISSEPSSAETPYAITTRSHCIYRQLQLKSVRDSPIFFVPGCSINHEEAQSENAHDIGEAPDQNSENWVDIDPDLLPLNVFHMLSRILGLQILREGIAADADSPADKLQDEQAEADLIVGKTDTLTNMAGQSEESKESVANNLREVEDDSKVEAAEVAVRAGRSRRSASITPAPSQHRRSRRSNPRSEQADYIPEEDLQQLQHERHDHPTDTGDVSIVSLEADALRQEDKEVDKEAAPIGEDSAPLVETTPVSKRKRGQKSEKHKQVLIEEGTFTDEVLEASLDTTRPMRRSKRIRTEDARSLSPSTNATALDGDKQQQQPSSEAEAEIGPEHTTEEQAEPADLTHLESMDGTQETIEAGQSEKEMDLEPEEETSQSQVGASEKGADMQETDVVSKPRKYGKRAAKEMAAKSQKRTRRNARGGDSSPVPELPSPAKTTPRKSSRNKKLKL